MYLMLMKGILKPVFMDYNLVQNIIPNKDGTECIGNNDSVRGVKLRVVPSFIFSHFQIFNYVLTLHYF